MLLMGAGVPDDALAHPVRAGLIDDGCEARVDCLDLGHARAELLERRHALLERDGRGDVGRVHGQDARGVIAGCRADADGRCGRWLSCCQEDPFRAAARVRRAKLGASLYYHARSARRELAQKRLGSVPSAPLL